MASPAAPNPYEAPRSDLDSPVAAPDATAPLATRWRRLGGSLVDGFLQGLANAIIFPAASMSEVIVPKDNLLERYLRHGPWGYVAGTAVASLLCLQSFLIARRGQTIGKIVAGTRIVRLDGARVDFLRGVVIREGIFWAPTIVPPALGIAADSGVGQVVNVASLVGILLIFGKSRRCLHDRIAGTKVIAVARTSNPAAG